MRMSILAVAVILALTTTSALPEETRIGQMVIENAWARASAGRAANGATYMTLRNTGASEDRLVAVSAEVARRAELHTHLMENNVMKMRPVKNVPVPAGGSVTLQPGGHHVMLMGLEKRLVKGESFPLTLTFAKAGAVTVSVPVGGVGDRGPAGAGMGGGKGHGHGQGGMGTMRKKGN